MVDFHQVLFDAVRRIVQASAFQPTISSSTCNVESDRALTALQGFNTVTPGPWTLSLYGISSCRNFRDDNLFKTVTKTELNECSQQRDNWSRRQFTQVQHIARKDSVSIWSLFFKRIRRAVNKLTIAPLHTVRWDLWRGEEVREEGVRENGWKRMWKIAIVIYCLLLLE